MTYKSILSLTCFLFSSLSLFGQSDEDLIRHSIHNYFNGTSYNNVKQIESAFFADAKLYLENREGELMVVGPKEYAGWFSKREAGTFSGRYNKLIEIKQTGNLAQVTAEITIPAMERVYTDIFIMRRMNEGEWLIIAKSANNRPAE